MCVCVYNIYISRCVFKYIMSFTFVFGNKFPKATPNPLLDMTHALLFLDEKCRPICMVGFDTPSSSLCCHRLSHRTYISTGSPLLTS